MVQQALVASGSTTDVVLMTTPDVYAHLDNDDKTQWSDIVLVPRLPNPYDDTGTKSRHVFTKLQAWSLTQYAHTAVAQAHTTPVSCGRPRFTLAPCGCRYSKIVLLDADVLPLHNLDALFQCSTCRMNQTHR